MEKTKEASEPQADPRSYTIRHLRVTIAERVANTSLRSIAREIGMSPAGLKKFLLGTAPYSPTLRRLRNWYVQYVSVQAGEVMPQDATAALVVLMHDLAPGARREIAEEILASLERGYAESGKESPRWVAELRVHYDVESVKAGSVPQRPSALGKYAHIPGTSEDFARLKQEEIDREDGRAA